MTATVHNIYMAVLMSVPYMVALGMFFSGDSMDVEGMVAHSSPKKAKKVSVVAFTMAIRLDDSVRLKTSK